MALEQSINADSKSKGGIVGISQSPAALEKWFLTVHEWASVNTALKEMCGVQDSDQVTHKKEAPKKVKRDEDDFKKLVSYFESSLMANPFSEDTKSLINFATSIILPSEVAEAPVSSTEKGQESKWQHLTAQLW